MGPFTVRKKLLLSTVTPAGASSLKRRKDLVVVGKSQEDSGVAALTVPVTVMSVPSMSTVAPLTLVMVASAEAFTMKAPVRSLSLPFWS